MPMIDPQKWLAVAQRVRPSTIGLTQWFCGSVAPIHVGWYERFFTDSETIPVEASMQYWDGHRWLISEGREHWRQVGEYPCWRGATDRLSAGQVVTLLRGSRGRDTGLGCGRRVRARLQSATPYAIHAVLLQDDQLASVAPFKAGEAGVWHGLSVLSEIADVERCLWSAQLP